MKFYINNNNTYIHICTTTTKKKRKRKRKRKNFTIICNSSPTMTIEDAIKPIFVFRRVSNIMSIFHRLALSWRFIRATESQPMLLCSADFIFSFFGIAIYFEDNNNEKKIFRFKFFPCLILFICGSSLSEQSNQLTLR